MDEIFEECIWHRQENNHNIDGDNSNTMIINDRRKGIHAEAETLPYISTFLHIKRSNCEGLEVSKYSALQWNVFLCAKQNAFIPSI